MYRPLKSLSAAGLLCLLLISPVLISGTDDPFAKNTLLSSVTSLKSANELVREEAGILYDSMKLKRFGLTKKAFVFAYQGFKHLKERGQLDNEEVISICDFSQSSRRKRLYIIDMEEGKVLMNTYVAHGRNSGGEYARSFSNSPESHKSSLGFYITRKTYFGDHGLALKLDGLENGINDNAEARNIVMHGSKYVGPNYLRYNRVNGRSFGCPAIPSKDTQKIINIIKDGSCLFIYHPAKVYLSQSKILNG